MSHRKHVLAGLVALAVSASAVARPELVPHRGVWKNYHGNDVAENSVSAFWRAESKRMTGTGDRPSLIEVDIRTMRIAGGEHPVVFHDKIFGRLTNYYDTYHWGRASFLQWNMPRTPISVGFHSWWDFNLLRLLANDGNGYTKLTGDRLHTLRDFMKHTVCRTGGVRLLLDVQTPRDAQHVANTLNWFRCPNGVPYRDKAVIKLFAANTIPTNVERSSVSDWALADRVIGQYGRGLKYYFQFNSGQFYRECGARYVRPDRKPCLMKAPAGRYIKTEQFIHNIMKHPNVEGVSLSLEASYPNTAGTKRLRDVNATIYWLYDWLNARKNGRKLMSVGSRPDDRIIWSSYGRNGSGYHEHQFNRCMMYNYTATDHSIRFFADHIFNERNAFAMRGGFDQIVVDGYVANGKLDYDLVREIHLLCGWGAYVTPHYQVKTNASANARTDSYKNMRNETRAYDVLDSIFAYPDQIESRYNR